MRLLIISDTLNKEQSIVPYGLRLARHLEMTVHVLHIVDRRDVKDVYSAYADSQTISVGVQSIRETLRNSIGEAETFLDKLISREASVLNYPLRVSHEVTEDRVEGRIIEESSDPDTMIAIGSQPDGSFWSGYDEISYVINRAECGVFLLPRNQEFKIPEEVITTSLHNQPDDDQKTRISELLKKLRFSNQELVVHPAKEYLDAENHDNHDLMVIYRNKTSSWKEIFSMRLSDLLRRIGTNPALVLHPGVL